MRSTGISLSSNKITFGQCAEKYLQNIDRDAELRPKSKEYYQIGLHKIQKTWPGINEVNVRTITVPQVRDWSLRLRSEALPHIPHGAKRAMHNSSGISASSYKGALMALRGVLEFAVESGHLFANPAKDKSIKRASPKSKRLVLPSRDQFIRVLDAVDSAGTNECRAAGEMIRLLAYTGARLNEARNVLWRDVDLAKGRVTLRITKNGETRDVPLIAECKAMLEDMRTKRSREDENHRVLRIRECQGFLNSACATAGTGRITHHDLRHLFATTCIEHGIDIPTIARCMGHKDGGALAMKLYGHLRDDHAKEAMKKVSFQSGIQTS